MLSRPPHMHLRELGGSITIVEAEKKRAQKEKKFLQVAEAHLKRYVRFSHELATVIDYMHPLARVASSRRP